MSLSEGDVTQWAVMEWAQVQARYLTPTQHHVLLYLCLNAFYKANNPEHSFVAQVLSKRASQTEIGIRTGLSRSSVKRSLEALREAGYILYDPSKDPYGASQINVCWREEFDEMRDLARTGSKPLPPIFRSTQNVPLKAPVSEPVRDNVIPFRRGQHGSQ